MEQNLVKDLVAQIIDEVDRRISLGMLRPGQRLVEPEMEEWLGVGRVPVREAIRVLSGEGVVEIVRGKGARIREADERWVVETVKVLTAITNAAIEDFLVKRSAGRELEELGRVSARLHLVASQNDPFRVMRGIGRYHWDLVNFSGNGMLRETLRKLRLNLYHHDLIKAAGNDAVIRCGRRYAAVTEALALGDRIEALELSEFLRDTILHAIRRNQLRQRNGIRSRAA